MVPKRADIDLGDVAIVPGFVNVHSHPTSEPGNKGVLEELGSPRLGQSSLYEFMLLVRPDEDARRAAALFAVSELLKSGVTTFTDYSATRAGWIEHLPPEATFIVFAVPFVVLFPLKLVGAWMIMRGKWLAACGIIIVAKWP